MIFEKLRAYACNLGEADSAPSLQGSVSCMALAGPLCPNFWRSLGTQEMAFICLLRYINGSCRTFFVDVFKTRRFCFAAFTASLGFQGSAFEWTILKIIWLWIGHWCNVVLGFFYFTFPLTVSLLPFTDFVPISYVFISLYVNSCPIGTEHFYNSYVSNRQGTESAGVQPREVCICWFRGPLH